MITPLTSNTVHGFLALKIFLRSDSVCSLFNGGNEMKILVFLFCFRLVV